MIILKLTPDQARFIWTLVDMQSDAGACKDGNTEHERRMIEQLDRKLLACKDQWQKKP